MSTLYSHIRVPSPTLGLILNQPASQLDRRACTRAHNIRFRDGAMEKVRGWRSFTNVPINAFEVAPINLIRRVPIFNGTVRTVVGTKFWLYTMTAGGVLVKLNASTFAGGDHDRWEMDMLGEEAFFAMITEDVQQLTAGGVTCAAIVETGGTCPKAKRLCQFEAHLLLGDLSVSGARQLPYYAGSGIDTQGGPEDWDFPNSASDAVLTLVPEGGDGVQRLIRGANYLELYKEFSIHALTYVQLPYVYVKQMVESSIGAMSGDSVVDIGGDRRLFVGQDNIYLMQSLRPQPIGDPVWTQFLSGISADSRDKVWSWADPRLREVTIAYKSANSGGVIDDQAYLWNWGTNAFSTRDWPFRSAGFHGIGATGGIWSDQSQTWSAWGLTWEDLLNAGMADVQTVVGDYSGFLYVIEEPLRDDSPTATITSEWESGDDCHDDPSRMKIEGGMYFDMPLCSGDPLEVYIGTRDNLTDAIVWNTTPYTIGASGRLDYLRTGRWFRRRFVKRGGRFVLREFVPLVQLRGQY